MSIVDRLNTLVRAELGALGRRPPRDQVRRTLREASAALGQARANERALEARRHALGGELADAHDQAARAAADGDDRVARHALERKVELEQEARRVDAELADHQRRLHDLRQALNELQAVAEARRAAADSAPRDDAATPPDALLDPEALHRLDELESRIASMEAEVQVDAVLDPLADHEKARLDREFRGLEARQALDDNHRATDALDRLRRTMNRDDET